MRLPFLSRADPHLQEVARGAAVALVLKVLGAVLTFLFNVEIARMFGAAGTGVFSLAFTVATIATVFGRMGMDNTLLRFVAASAAAGDWVAVKGAYRKGIGISTAAATLATVVLVVAAPWVATLVFHDPALLVPIRWMALAVIPVTVFTLLAAMLQGLKRVFASTVISAVAAPGIAAVVLLWLGRADGPVTAILAYVAGAATSAAAAWRWWRRVTPQLATVRGTFETRVLLESSLPLLWVASMSMAMNWIATFALGVWGTTADVGVFNAASRATFLVSFVLIAVNTISAPKFAALHRAGQFAALATTARASERLMVALAAPILLGFLVFPRQIMTVFGPDFRTGAVQLAILAIAQAANVMTGSVGYLLMMSGHERQVRDSNTIAAITCLLCAVALVRPLGGTGAAIAVAAALIVRNIVEVWQVKRYLGIGVLFLPPPSYETARYR